ncbi:MAG: ABC transporter substrate-binding protein [Candidatus Limnocylindrales bacterium]
MPIGGLRRGSGRYVATVLFVDIAGSTERAAQLGDAAWKSLLGRYYAVVRDGLRHFGGREIDTAGDGLFAVFAVPADAVTCAFAVRDGAAALGLAVRSGLHSGEVQSIEGKVGGIAVHIGARIAAAAASGEVLVSSTVKDLVAGSRLRFEDRGETDLKGVPERWRLFAASPPLEQAIDLPSGPQSAGIRTGVRLPASARGRAVLVGIVGLALVAAGAGAFALSPRPTSPAPTATAPQSAGATPAPVVVAADSVGRMDADGRVIAATPVGGLPDGVAVANGSLWVANTTDGTVSRLDSATGRVVQTIHVGASPAGIASGFGAIWVADSGDRTVDRIDPTTNDVVATFTVGISPTGIAADASWIWVANRLDGSISRIDPDTGTVTTIPLGQTPTGIATASGAVWITDFDSGTVVRLDSQSGVAAAPIHVGNGPSAVAATADAVWVANTRDGTVSRVDPLTGSVRATVTVGADPGGLAIAPGSVWVAVSSTSEMVRIDPATDAVSRFEVAASPQGVAMDGDEPIFTARAAQGSHRGGTLRIVSGALTLPSSPDPAYAWSSLTLLTNDTLLAYKRVGGSDGSTLVPDLATSIPVATDGGLTYTIQLVSGVTYSTGAPIRASDVRRSIERTQAAGAPYGPFGDIVGADRCEAAKPCDLSAGIVVDDQAGTVTFRLVAPDPSFPYVLAGSGAIEPADTPFQESKAPLPATGPYMFDLFTDHEIRLVRNPGFHEWSRAAQPDGYPDVIDWTLAPTGTDPSTLVESGLADVDVDTIPPDRLANIATRLPAQLHVASAPYTFFEFMNTAVAPFDDVRVRRAVSLAVDRQAAVDAYGGPLQARITCQVVPPTFAGYQPYCPYTVLPDASGSWRGPDLPAARALIDQAGVKGQSVTVYGLDLPGHRDVARYFAGLLTTLGFKATTKLESLDAMFTPPAGITTHASNAQMVGFWYLTQPPIASAMILGTFTCPDFPNIPYDGYPARFCDHALDEQAKTALGLDQSGDRAAANALWAQIDRRIVDAAPAVMVFNPTDVVFLSRRVGNYQHHPEWEVLLDQLWVQ